MAAGQLWMGIAAIVFVFSLSLFLYLLFVPARSQRERGNIRNIVQSQRGEIRQKDRSGSASIFRTAEEQAQSRSASSSRLTLAKKLKYATWKMPLLVYRLLEVVISLVGMYAASLFFHTFIVCVAAFSGPLFMGWLLNNSLYGRFKKFDGDYPAFLLSVVGLLKTGLNTMGALEAAAKGLNPDSLVRYEVETMIERVRVGVPEDRSIGSFGENINHPEIELFVQAILLSRRVGGNLSATLDRLARQVRKRQYFRSSAIAAIGMQRGSIWMILAMMIGLLTYLYFSFPESILGAIKDDIGWIFWQIGLTLIAFGVWWIRQVTKIKV